MPVSVNVQTRIDPAIRKEAAVVLKSIGLSISDVMRMMLIRIAQDKAVPFELFRPNEATISALREAQAGSLKSFDSVAELMADLNEDDQENDAVQEGLQTREKRAIPGDNRE